MKLALLQHHKEEHAGYVKEWASANDITLLPWLTPEHAAPLLATDIDGVIVLGGEFDLVDREQLPWMQQELAWLRHALEAEKPIVGICLGCQLLAHLLGGEVRALPQAEFGVQRLTLSDGKQLDVLQAHRYHVTLPNGAALLGSTALCQQQIYHHSAQRVMGLQCHLEWSTQMYRDLIGKREGDGVDQYDNSNAKALLFHLLTEHFIKG